MAVVSTYSHQFMLETLRKEHDIEDDTLKIILLGSAFEFDPDTHSTYATVSASEIANGYGYTTGGDILTNVAVSIDTVNNKVDIAADSVTWTATGGAIPTVGSAIVYNDTHASKTVVMCIDFGADYDTPDTKLFQINFAGGFGQLENA